jgi:amino acid transporter
MVRIKDLILGKPVKNSDIKAEKLSRVWGLPIMASDAVSSVAYAGEEILLILCPVIGVFSFRFVPFVTLPILLLLLILVFSYSQIIDHYPNGGGAYVVSKENLGTYPALLAAAALVVDYIMTVAVSISSATAAIAAAFPAVDNYKVELSLLFVFIITLGNLRGLRESSKLFGLPTYIFIFSMALMIIVGFFRFVTGGLHPMAYAPAQIANYKNSLEGLGLALLLRSFSSGCAALTGVEAVSNSIPNFKEPCQRNAKQILFMLAGVIIFIFGGTTFLEIQLRVMPVAGITVTSQIASAVFGPGSFMFFIIQIFTAVILILAANTSYNGLPLLLYILAHDGFVPRQFSHRGTKLSFSNGIMFICVVACLLIIQFQSDVHRLIPLYSIGVFISFTLSQYGMFHRWLKLREKGWSYKCLINGFGALVTLVTLCVVFVYKFTEGAWMLLIAIPAIMAFMLYVNRHYRAVGKALALKKFYPYYERTPSRAAPCIVLLQTINRSLLKSLNYANSISDNIVALHVCRHPEHAEQLRRQWDALHLPVKLEIVLTPYQDIIGPFNDYITAREKKLKHGENLSVIIVKFVSEHWYDAILHNQTTYFLERILSRHKNVSSIILPFHYRLDGGKVEPPMDDGGQREQKCTAEKETAAGGPPSEGEAPAPGNS